MGQYLIKHTCNEQPQYKNGAASPTIPVSVGMPENSQKKLTPAIRILEVIQSTKIKDEQQFKSVGK